MTDNSPKCSIIIRSKNEERWIGLCLERLKSQTYQNFEVILVDNHSEDATVAKARQYGVTQVVEIDEYLPGKSLNAGIRESKGEFIVCLSGHCIPVNDVWLENLVDVMCKTPLNLAGAYGRQEPLSSTSEVDRRDLLITFGLDQKIQERDSFFHNANSIIRRDIWEKVHFDENATNIEDRIWAKEVLERGYRIAYEPSASVYHHHGIHHGRDPIRARSTIKIVDSLSHDSPGHLSLSTLKKAALIPIRKDDILLSGNSLLQITIDYALKCQHIDQIIVLTDNATIARTAEKMGAEIPFLRPPHYSDESIGLDQVYTWAVRQLAELNHFPDIVITLEVTYPFRPYDLVDKMIQRFVSSELDALLAGYEETRTIWHKDIDGGVSDLGPNIFCPRAMRQGALIDIKGLCSILRPDVLRRANYPGEKTAIWKVNNDYAIHEVRDNKTLELLSLVYDHWRREEYRD